MTTIVAEPSREPLAELQPAEPTLWGMSIVELYDRFWAARGVQVVRCGEASEVVDGAELFLLTDPDRLMVFRLRGLINKMAWIDPKVVFVRLHDSREHGYREVANADENGRFLGFTRSYGGNDSVRSRVALTTDRTLAEAWQQAESSRDGWHMLRGRVPRARRSVQSASASVFDRKTPEETVSLVRRLIEFWPAPTSTIDRARPFHDGVFIDESARVDQGVTFVGPAWIGAGRRLKTPETVVGPVVLWDDPAARPRVEHVRWEAIEPSASLGRTGERRAPTRRSRMLQRGVKRVFDLVTASLAMIASLPLWPLIMLAIYLEDGRPFFFAHRRETLGGREFPCWKFRSMRKDAEEIKQRIMLENQVDGPQFYIDDDPRITRVGRFLRKTQLDELPQLLNVILGHMSIVGPRPSPHKENQYCPAWRETRLSVRPGITGLWQVKRTREEGLDFQEWIRYDIEYVENASFVLDLKIILATVCLIVGLKKNNATPGDSPRDDSA
jgi:lipopolysaccharide/colanic/teichoic acid biosynthesis glycosyltransferase